MVPERPDLARQEAPTGGMRGGACKFAVSGRDQRVAAQPGVYQLKREPLSLIAAEAAKVLPDPGEPGRLDRADLVTGPERAPARLGSWPRGRGQRLWCDEPDSREGRVASRRTREENEARDRGVSSDQETRSIGSRGNLLETAGQKHGGIREVEPPEGVSGDRGIQVFDATKRGGNLTIDQRVHMERVYFGQTREPRG